MEMNSIDHEHEFKTLEKSQDQLKMLKCNDLTLNHKGIYCNFSFLPSSSLLAFTYIPHTGHVNSVTWNT